MRTRSLTDSVWTIEGDGYGSMPAVVPGCAHDALHAAGVIPVPDAPGGEQAQAFVGRTDWTWRTSFTITKDMLEEERVELVLESIDAVGTVRVNGTVVGEVASQFIPYRFDVRSVLRSGENDLELELLGTLAEAERLEALHGARPVNADGEWGPFSQLRKSACNFGWDWGPCCPTCGIAGEVRVEGWTGARIAAIRPQVLSLSAEEACLLVAIDLDGEASSSSVTIRDENAVVLARSEGEGPHRIDVKNPPIWWPRGLGAQPLVTVDVELEDGTRSSCRTGLRLAEIEDGDDGAFAVRVNGERIFCRGANWIPSRLFPHGQTIDDVEPLLQAACAANMNMLRIWGGGIYEPNWFYERCDELGLMVWQDFMFACATYPEHEEMIDLVREEAECQLRRLAPHPSIVLWCGGNEDVLAWFSWGWREKIGEDADWGLRYWTEILPAACTELDAGRPYWTESPWSGSIDVHPNDPDRGDRHTWDLKIEGYRDIVPRFASEFGHQAPPNLRSIEEALGRTASELEPGDLATRQRAWGGDDVQYAPYLEKWFGITPNGTVSFERWHWAAQLLQARAMSIACTWLRAHTSRCEGALIWQLNDVWTGHSWSLLDVRHRPKPVYHAVQAAFDPLLVALEPVDGRLAFVLLNETLEDVQGEACIRRVDFEGREHASHACDVDLAARRGRMVLELPESVVAMEDPSREVIVASFGERRAFWFQGSDRLLAYPEPRHEVTHERISPSSIRVEVTARSLLRDLHLQVDRLGVHARVDRGLVTLLPGQRASLVVSGIDPSCTLESIKSLVRTANELVQPS